MRLRPNMKRWPPAGSSWENRYSVIQLALPYHSVHHQMIFHVWGSLCSGCSSGGCSPDAGLGSKLPMRVSSDLGVVMDRSSCSRTARRLLTETGVLAAGLWSQARDLALDLASVRHRTGHTRSRMVLLRA